MFLIGLVTGNELTIFLFFSLLFKAAQSLGSGSLLINPWNVKDVANAILKAVTMPVETRAQKMALLYNFVIGILPNLDRQLFLFYSSSSVLYICVQVIMPRAGHRHL